MKNIIILITIFLPLFSFGNELIISPQCEEAMAQNMALNNQISEIKNNIAIFDESDNSKGYNLRTGIILASSACLYVDGISEDICHGILDGMREYAIDQNNGFSPETARILNSMAGGKCL